MKCLCIVTYLITQRTRTNKVRLIQSLSLALTEHFYWFNHPKKTKATSNDWQQLKLDLTTCFAATEQMLWLQKGLLLSHQHLQVFPCNSSHRPSSFFVSCHGLPPPDSPDNSSSVNSSLRTDDSLTSFWSCSSIIISRTSPVAAAI